LVPSVAPVPVDSRGEAGLLRSWSRRHFTPTRSHDLSGDYSAHRPRLTDAFPFCFATRRSVARARNTACEVFFSCARPLSVWGGGWGAPRFHSFALAKPWFCERWAPHAMWLIPGGDCGGANFDQRGDLVSQNLAQCNMDIGEGHIELCEGL